MKTVRLDGQCMVNKETAHHYIQSQLGINDYYGHNLDALYDVLSVYDKKIWIVFTNKSSAFDFLGEYAEQITETFQDIAKANENIRLNIL
ncbi:MAG: barstar family protein [Alkalibacterium gilvum]|uniref:barstar family protein n=1 Tax=Alkalibacterium gilvum TaxID=1130080 RepID=UPI002652F3C3|nr:barstar family protein [Alkalibacterium sp.]MDN6730196.1 barstar family protein [Alkalibacterium sp.]